MKPRLKPLTRSRAHYLLLLGNGLSPSQARAELRRLYALAARAARGLVSDAAVSRQARAS